MAGLEGPPTQPGSSSDEDLSEERAEEQSATSTTEPDAIALFQALRLEVSLQRTRSPYPRPHNRSHSAVASSAAPPMTRTRSLPLYETRQRLGSPSHSPVRPASPLRPPPASRGSPRRSLEEVRPLLPVPSFMDIESIAEDSELDLNTATRRAHNLDPLQYGSLPQAGHSLSRSGSGRRRPASPLQTITSSAYGPYSAAGNPSSPSRLGATPSPPSGRFNESYPGGLAPSSSSSMPSTPTSLRSRSPSISSLETIPDSPDAEAEAMEAFNILKLKAAADAEDFDEDRKNGRSGRGRLAGDAGKRKRWSVCGAERRGDFEMETIWED